MTTQQIETTEVIYVPDCQHEWWNLVHVTCCMKCGQSR